MGKALTFLCASVSSFSSSAEQVSRLCPAPRGTASTCYPEWPWSTGGMGLQHHCWGSTRPDAAETWGEASPDSHGKRELTSPFSIPYTNSQKCIFTLAHISSHTKPFLPFGAFLLYSCPDCYQLVWAGGKILKALKCLLLEQQQPFWSPSPAGFQWALGYPSTCFF